MTVLSYNPYTITAYQGLSSDVKPTDATINPGSTFLTVDTHVQYVYNGSSWFPIGDGVAAANLATSQVSIPTTAGGALLYAPHATSKRTVVLNTDAANSVYISSNATPTALNGLRLSNGQSIVLYTTATIYAIASTGVVVVAVLEEYY